MIEAEQAVVAEKGSLRFNKLIEQCREMVISHLVPQLHEMEENTEVALLDFAEKAETNASQAEFFDAMQEIRRKQSVMARRFLDQLGQAFNDFPPNKAASRGTSDPTGEDELSLVDKDEVELSLPLQNMVSKAGANYMQPLFGLSKRLAVINGGHALDDEALLAGPAHLAQAIREAVNVFEIDNKIQVILFVLFDKYVMGNLGPMYEEFNRRLIEAKILPNLKYEIQKRKQAAGPGSQGQQAADEQGSSDQAAGAQQPASIAGAPSVGEEIFNSVCQLMVGRRQTAGGAPIVEPAPAVAAQGRQQLLTTLGEIQVQHVIPVASEAQTGLPLIEDIQVDEGLIQRVREALADERRKLYAGIDRRKIPTADMDMIDLVGMLFDCMLDDKNLPASVKALLSRLHTPYLKVAVLDKQLFTQEAHPARKLLDEMINAGSRMVSDDQLDRGLFPALRAIVERIMEDFDQDITLFSELRKELANRINELEHKSKIIEKRAVEAADGQARLQAARTRAADEIHQRLEGGQWPARIVDLLQRVWSEKLMFILLREKVGEESEAWAEAIEFVDQVLWSVNPDNVGSERDAFEAPLSGINEALVDTLDSLSCFGHHDPERMMSTIEDCQQAAIAASIPPQAPVQDSAPPTSDAESDQPAEPTQVAEPIPQQSIQQEVWETVEPEPEEAEAEQELSAEELAMIDKLRETKFGTWFEFNDDGKARRVKLAWFSVLTSNCMFVDAMGVKADERSFPDLARAMCEGSARIVQGEKRPFFDRAMDSVFGLLKKSPKAAAAT